jgi:hypothetical protein
MSSTPETQECKSPFHPYHAASCAQNTEFEEDFPDVHALSKKCRYLDTISNHIFAARYLGKPYPWGMSESTYQDHIKGCWTCTPELSPYYELGLKYGF